MNLPKTAQLSLRCTNQYLIVDRKQNILEAQKVVADQKSWLLSFLLSLYLEVNRVCLKLNLKIRLNITKEKSGKLKNFCLEF